MHWSFSFSPSISAYFYVQPKLIQNTPAEVTGMKLSAHHFKTNSIINVCHSFEETEVWSAKQMFRAFFKRLIYVRPILT